jgi:uncharacterized integral membrane protein
MTINPEVLVIMMLIAFISGVFVTMSVMSPRIYR